MFSTLAQGDATLLSTFLCGNMISAMVDVIERSMERITLRDLRKLGGIAASDRESFFTRHPNWRTLYEDRVLAVTLCQGAAQHYVDRTNGVKDFDVWTFFARHPDRQYPYRRRGTQDFGASRFGRHPDDIGYKGRRVDLIGRALYCTVDADPIDAIRAYLRASRTETARRLSKKTVVLIEPLELCGKVIWPDGIVKLTPISDN